MQQEQQRASASDIAAAMLRFCEGAAHPSRLGPPAGWPRTTEPAYIFLYSNERVLRDGVAKYLSGLDGPVLLSPTMTAGTIVVTMLSDLKGAALSASQERFKAREAPFIPGMKDDDPILLECDGESLIFPASTLHACSRRYIVVDVTWMVSRLENDARAKFSLDLRRSDGHSSTHWSYDV